MAAVLIKSTNFAAAGVLAAGAANSTLYDGWKDLQGSIFKTVTAAPNSRLAINGTTAYNLYQSAGMSALRDVRAIFALDAPANHNLIGARITDDGTGKPSNFGYVLVTSVSQISIQMNSPVTGVSNIHIVSWNSLTGPCVVVWEVAQSGTNISTLRTRVCTRTAWNAVANAADNLDSVTWTVDSTYVHNVSGAGSDQGRFQSAGWATIRYATGLEWASFYDTSAPLTRGRYVTTYLDDIKATLVCTNSGGAQPITKRHHIGTEIPTLSVPIGVNSGTEVPGQTGFGSDTLNYTFTDDNPRWFVCKAVDTGNVTTFSNLIQIRRGKKPLHVVFFGDSYTEGLGLPWDPCDAAIEALRALDPLRTFTHHNHGISQTSARSWLPSADSEYNDNGLGGDVGGFINRPKAAAASAKAANPNARIVASFCIGINDAGDQGGNPANAISPATFAAQISRICTALFDTGNFDAIYLQHPPWVATQLGSHDGSTGGTGSRRALNLFNYRAAVEGLANATTIRVGDRDAWTMFGAFPQHNGADNGSLPGEGHPHQADTNTGSANLPDGNRQLGNLWALAIARGEGILSSGSGSAAGTPFRSPIFGG